MPPLQLLALALGLAASLGAAAAPAVERGPTRAATPVAEETARVIVRFKPGTVRELALAFDPRAAGPALQMARALSQRRGITLADGPSIDPHTQVMLAHGVDAQVLARRLADDPDVEWVEVDRRQRIAQTTPVPDDPLYPAGQTAATPAVGQWYLRAPNATEVSAIDAPAAWALTTGAPGIVVAVIDTGVRFEHPDLRRAAEGGKLLPGYDFVSDTATANDGDGRDPDPSDPGDWITPTENAGSTFRDCGVSDSSWHGTQTAGLAGALTNNALGVAGAGWDLRVLPVRALGKCGGYVSDIAAGIRWAAGLAVPGIPITNPNPARVINLSLGSQNRCDSTYQSAIDAVRAIGVTVVAAAGNEGVAVNQPANCKGVIAVAGVRHTGTKVGYSNLGPQVALAAPAGNCINLSGPCLYPLATTSNDGDTVPVNSIYTGSGADATLGTSFASPLVAASVGLMLSVHPSLAPDEVATRLRAAARPFPPRTDPAVPLCRVPTGFDDTPQLECYCTTDTCGAGLLDAGGAVAAALRPSASFTATPTTADVDQVVVLDGSTSTVAAGATPSYRWTIVGGTATAAFTTAVDGATAQLQASTSGSVVVQLTVADGAGRTSSMTAEISVREPDSGGGASGPGWILALAVATFALRLAGRRRRP